MSDLKIFQYSVKSTMFCYIKNKNVESINSLIKSMFICEMHNQWFRLQMQHVLCITFNAIQSYIIITITHFFRMKHDSENNIFHSSLAMLFYIIYLCVTKAASFMFFKEIRF